MYYIGIYVVYNTHLRSHITTKTTINTCKEPLHNNATPTLHNNATADNFFKKNYLKNENNSFPSFLP